ncbi:MAG: hypothetical protein KJ771_01350 [Nanoarchaeota archaeon]|nr:hypothetical protein [Nanoarchaeota archaeon]
MNKEVSNQTLVVLVGVAIVISVIGLLTSTLSTQNITGTLITNVTADTGTTSFGVKSNIVLTITDPAINLGDLEIDENKTSEDVTDWFVIRNDGSIDFDVYAYGIDSPFTSTANGANLLPNNYYFVHANSSDSGTANTTYVSVPNGVGNKHLLIDALDNEGGLDTAKIGIKVIVPHDEQAGAKTADLTIYVESI